MGANHARVGLAAIVAVALAQCVDPTAIEVVVTTDIACANVNEVAIAVGAPGDDSSPVRAHTTSCSDDGGIGTLVVTPSGGFDDVVGVRAMLGVGTSAESCTAPNFTGCVVARRTLRYTPHAELVLPIALDQACLGVTCDPNDTCVNGACVGASVGPCDGGVCTVADASAPDAPSGPDAGDAGDAGACADSGNVLITDGLGFKAQPHVVRVGTGWAVIYETAPSSSARELDAALVDSTFAASQPKKLGGGQAGLAFGSFASDGASYFYTRMSTPTAASGETVPIGVGSPTGTGAVDVAALSQQGLVWDGTSQYFFLVLTQTNDQVAVVSYAPATQSLSVPKTLDVIAAQSPTLSASNGAYFASYLDGQGDCKIQQCSSLAPPSCAPIDVPSCTAAQAALAGAFVLVAERDSIGNGYVIDGAQIGQRNPIGVMDANGPVVLVSPPSSFRVLWSQSGVLESALVSSNLAPGAAVALTPTGPISPPLLFDAVADPSGPGYAIAYYDFSSTRIYFRHVCP